MELYKNIDHVCKMLANIWWRVMCEQLIVIHLVKILYFYKLKVHYCNHKILPLNPMHNLTTNLSKIQFNFILPPILGIPHGYTFCFLQACCMCHQYVNSESKYSCHNPLKCWGTMHPASWHHSPVNLNAPELLQS